MSRKERVIKSKIDMDQKTLTIQTEGKEDMIVDYLALDQVIIIHACLHGMKQKICDSAALGAGATITEKYNAMRETFERITGDDPSWNKRTGESVVTGLLFRALCRLYPEKNPDTIKEYHDKLDRSQQYALRQNPKVAAIIEEIKLESSGAENVDTDSMLDELEDI